MPSLAVKNFAKSIESLWDNNPTYDDLKAHDNLVFSILLDQ
jgi:hypothetical protein